MAGTVLVADDEREITDVCRRYLEREGYEVLVADNGEEAYRLWKDSRPRPDLLILDLMMPGRSGLDVCSAIRDEEDVPIIMLTARGEESDRLIGLTLGADDYVVKPFSPRELVLRVRNLLRRAAPRPASGDQETPSGGGAPSSDLHFEGMSIFRDQRRVTVNGIDEELTVKEFDLLEWMARHPGQVFSRSQLLSRVWNIDFEGDSTTVTVHMRRLREKIEPNPSEPTFVKTVWGIGYKFEGRPL
ncbi:response regulator transcription factor [Cohnella zeiphila]|uniref:Response regulator transcription factor n=1 Tax=Cohnella zeiphila TaxID=2761120 RepID=A0A7X0SN35_9BACL|nr:response regulator transcription factor [Cohnella zeiphila]MBB6733032.1 response regulator transcription factor [Cohnella zeiphila]